MAESKPAVLVDTNILFSGLVSLKGNEHRILRLAEHKAIALVLPQFVLEEARIVLSRRFPGHEALLDAFISKTEHTLVPSKEIEQSVSLYEKRIRDRTDAGVLATVIAAKPDFTVTGDAVLREDMMRCEDIVRITRVCSSKQFLKKALKTQR